MKTSLLILSTILELIGTACANAELGMSKEQCDDFYLQDGDPYGQKFDSSNNEIDPTYLYQTPWMKVIVHTRKNTVIAMTCKAAPGIADKDIKEIASRNGFDLSG